MTPARLAHLKAANAEAAAAEGSGTVSKWGDVIYEVWRSGGNVDHIDRERVEDDLCDGAYAYEAAWNEVRRQERAHDRMLAGVLPDDGDEQ